MNNDITCEGFDPSEKHQRAELRVEIKSEPCPFKVDEEIHLLTAETDMGLQEFAAKAREELDRKVLGSIKDAAVGHQPAFPTWLAKWLTR